MALPTHMQQTLFPVDNALFLGLALGTPASKLKGTLPAWIEQPVPTREGKIWGDFPSGHAPTSDDDELAPDEYIVTVTLFFSVGRLSQVRVSFDAPSEQAMVTASADLAAQFDERGLLGGHSQKKRSGKVVHEGWWSVTGEPKGQVTMRSARLNVPYGDDLWRTEIAVELAKGVELTEDTNTAWIDAEALAQVVATKAWPAARCAEVFREFFAHDDEWTATSRAPKAAAALREIYQAAKDADTPEQLEARVAKFLALCDWSDAHVDTSDSDANRLRYATSVLSHYSANLSVVPGPNCGVWLKLNSKDLFRFVCLLTTTTDDRPRWAARVSAALDFHDDAAFDEVAKAIAERRKVAPEHRWNRLTWDSGDALDGRAFELISSGLSVDDRLRYAPTCAHKSSAIRAATTWLASHLNVAVPALSSAGVLPQELSTEGERNADAWARFLALVKQHSPELFVELFEVMLDALNISVDSADAVCALLADEVKHATSGDTWKNVTRVGPVVVSRTGKTGNRGRLTFKRHPDEVSASKDFAKKAK